MGPNALDTMLYPGQNTGATGTRESLYFSNVQRLTVVQAVSLPALFIISVQETGRVPFVVHVRKVSLSLSLRVNASQTANVVEINGSGCLPSLRLLCMQCGIHLRMIYSNA